MSAESTPRALKARNVQPSLPDLEKLTIDTDNDDTCNLPIVNPSKEECLRVPVTPLRKTVSAITLRASTADDVFTTPGMVRRGSNNSAVTVVPPPGQEAANKIRQVEDMQMQAVARYGGHAPRADRGIEPNAANAQGLFSPDALVFAANLSTSRTEDQLALACHEVFDVFGKVHVKIKQDKNKHPFALLQFERAEDAMQAIQHGQGSVIDGRQVRLEQAKAERAVVITNLDGENVTEPEARAILERYGSIEEMFPTRHLSARPTNLPQGQYVRYAYYLDCRDALKHFNSHSPQYRLQLASGYEDRIKQDLATPMKVPHYTVPRSTTDEKSIFVGNLPEGTTRQDLAEWFAEFGEIIDNNVISKVYPGNSVNTFGFVEFATPDQAFAAASVEKFVGKQKLRVEPKEYSARRPQRLATVPATPPARNSPRRLTAATHGALSARLRENNIENFGHVVATPPATVYNPAAANYTPGVFATPIRPENLIPAHLLSPTPTGPPPFFGGYYYGYEYGGMGGYEGEAGGNGM